MISYYLNKHAERKYPVSYTQDSFLLFGNFEGCPDYHSSKTWLKDNLTMAYSKKKCV